MQNKQVQGSGYLRADAKELVQTMLYPLGELQLLGVSSGQGEISKHQVSSSSAMGLRMSAWSRLGRIGSWHVYLPQRSSPSCTLPSLLPVPICPDFPWTSLAIDIPMMGWNDGGSVGRCHLRKWWSSFPATSLRLTVWDCTIHPGKPQIIMQGILTERQTCFNFEWVINNPIDFHDWSGNKKIKPKDL